MDSYQVHLIAMKTLKQRCEYLQERLKVVEEENCKLKLEMTQDFSNKISKESNNLEERIVILNEEKSQMTHQIQMIVKENFTLWSQLSKILPGSNIPSLKFSVSADEDNAALNFNQYDNISYDCSKESLEEISLKGIIIGKDELEKQFSQMIDLHKGNIPEQNSSLFSRKVDSRVDVKNLKEYVQKLKDFKHTLLQQKSDLSNAINNIKKLEIFSKDHVSDYQKAALASFITKSDVNNPTDFELLNLEGSDVAEKDQKFEICPMCAKSFTEEFKGFYKHVIDHLDNENDDFVDARGDFGGVQ